jgi:hypothetical protein
MIVEARLIDGLSDDAVRDLFNSAREADYRALAKEIRAVEKDAAPAQVARLRADARIAAIDFFGASSKMLPDARAGMMSQHRRHHDVEDDACHAHGVGRRDP